MNARELIDKLSANPTSPLDLAATSAAALPTILSALRLLAAAEANDGTGSQLIEDLRAEADLCRCDETATDIAELLDDAASALVATGAQFNALKDERNGLAARVAELEKDAERSSKKIDFLRLELFSETTARKSAENELFAAIQDADRYRWLRVQRHADLAACWYLPVMPQDYPVDTPEQRDIAIDAARSK